MNVVYNTALRQSKAINNDLASLQSKPEATAADIGNVSVTLTTFGKTVDEYHSLARQEIVPKKQQEALDRVRRFRDDLAAFRSQIDGLRRAREDARHQTNRAELLGRRPYPGTTPTPENPYSDAHIRHHHGHQQQQPQQQQQQPHDGAARETHALREQSFMASTNQALDEYIARGQAVLGDLGQQREMLKNTQKRLYTVANTLGVSGETIRMVERRARGDRWIFGVGVVVFFAFCWLVLHYLR